ncbi:MAG TPA: tetratricopeptide repeat protein [Cyclobacteriaceae bacterium]|nr:tetratricopeptide repeat protein [Cyclobacteriaceae bacterium]
MFKLATLAFCLAAVALMAQDKKKIDSLKLKLQSVHDEDRFQTLNELFKQTSATNFNEALGFAEEYCKMAESIKDSVKMVQGGRMKSNSLMYLARNEEAVAVLLKILGIARRNQKQFPELHDHIKFILNNVGVANMYLGNYDKSLEFHLQSLELREKEGEKVAVRTSYNNIGLVYFNLKEFEKAIQYYKKGIELSKVNNLMTGADRIYINLGLSYQQLERHNEAIQSINSGFKICESNCSDNIKKEGWEGLGLAQLGKKEYRLAKENFEKSLEIARKQNDKRVICEILLFLGEIELELKNETKGIRFLKEAEFLAEEIHLAKIKILIYKDFAEYYSSKKDYENSTFYHHKYSEFKDSVFSERLIGNLTTLQNRLDLHGVINVSTEKNQITLQDENILRIKRQALFVIASCFFTSFLAVWLYFFTRRQQRINQSLSDAIKIFEEQNFELESFNEPHPD